MESVDDSVLISVSTEGGGRRKHRARRSKDVVKTKAGGLAPKKTHKSLQIDEGDGYSVDVADEAAFKHYVFVNADEYGLFDQKRRFLQSIVCYQVLSTAWNSSVKRDPSSLKPRYLFLFSDALFVMKLHDLIDTNTRRYRILGRLNLLDVSVEEVGEDMFDVVARGMGAMRFSMGSGLAKTQTVETFRKAIRRRQSRMRSGGGGATSSSLPSVPAPSNPDDVYEVMNFALSVLEKKMRGTATEEEQWQTDVLLKHALEMQERLHNPSGESIPAALAANKGEKSLTGGASAQSSLMAQLQAKEAQLRATEERAAAAEAALNRLRGISAAEAASSASGESRDLALENRTLRLTLERTRAQLEEREKQMASLTEELVSFKRAARVDQGGDVKYHEGTVDDILTRIQRAPGVAQSTPAADDFSRRRREDEEQQQDKRRRDEAERERREADERREAEERRRRAAEDERREAEERRRRDEERRVAEEAEQEARNRESAQRSLAVKPTAKVEESSEILSSEEEDLETASSEAPVRSNPVQSSPPPPAPLAQPQQAASKALVVKSVTEEESEGETGGEFSTSLSDDDNDSGDDDELRSFLSENELSHLFKTLEAKTSLKELKTMNLAAIRNLGLSYADSSNLATALGIKVVHG